MVVLVRYSLMQSFSMEKCAGIHAFSDEFAVYFLVPVLPSSKELKNTEKILIRFQHNSISARMAPTIVVLAFDPLCYYGSFNTGSKAFYP